MQIKHIHGGNLWAAADQNGLSPREMMDFSANINPLGASTAAVEGIITNLDTIIHYPDPNCVKLKRAVAEHTGMGVDNILMGNGAVELVYLLLSTLRPKQVLLPAPTFGEYESAVLIAGGQVTDYFTPEEKGFAIQVEDILARLAEVDMVVICNPNNPTGTLMTAEEIMTVVREARKQQVFVMVDEAFLDFLPDRQRYSVAPYVENHENLFVSYSLTKFLGMPGLRLGAAFACSQMIRLLEARKDPWNVNCLAQIAGEISLQDKEYLENTRQIVAQEKDYLFKGLQKIKGLTPYYPSVNYIMVKLPEGTTAAELQQALFQYKIMIRDCSSYKNLSQSYIRVAVKDRASNHLLLRALKAIYGEG
ncbi:MAG TPA: threonine-phosphate decarboxylase CobD [Bacillota bacterium]|nr:threonine-phosphate decarboxylase CobD [Bacillota bacterium]